MRLRPSLTMMPAEPQCVIRASNRDEPGPYRDEPVLHRDEPWTTGAPPESIKMFNTSGMNRESRVGPATTCVAPGTTGLYREQPGRHLSSPGPKHTPAELRQRPGGAPVNAGRVPL
ncbi:hypothetical protein DPMN_186591 [Dreissena polymorpha]|uniref:Uncharacterized protein n=1 Tax=Dreissena polymorpha TaxID=45954 RepID=A0A9D4DN47_DREPO|nr:hypothetical protein DPMN_186591 [Dreissena polymorpha]